MNDAYNLRRMEAFRRPPNCLTSNPATTMTAAGPPFTIRAEYYNLAKLQKEVDKIFKKKIKIDVRDNQAKGRVQQK